jgi:hypothetical protein
MNKTLDERIVPNGEYIDALNVRMGSTEGSEVGVIENSKGNSRLSTLAYDGNELSDDARCIGAFEDGANETIYWFVNDPNFTASPTNKLDLIVSLNVQTGVIVYHVVSVNDGGGTNTTLNFNNKYLITGVNKIEDLLFFTDNYNQPRKINVKSTYDLPSAGIDGFTNEAILVIKKPPINSPTIIPLTTGSEENFLEDRFICFAYRYKYADGEYSATSQFTVPTFLPGTFNYNIATALNDGMLNTTNQCEIVYNTGGPLVKSVELLFKDMNSSVIKIIEEIDKSKLGLTDNSDETYVFTNSKIFTILPDSEILRLYDNVPRLAQAQTLMGNRLFYGNYLEDYELVDLNDDFVKLEYITTLSSEDVGLEELTYVLDDNQAYYIDNNIATTVTDSIVYVDFAGVNLVAGALINITIRFEHAQWSGDTPYPTDTTTDQIISFTYRLQQDFSSVYALASDPDFLSKVGTIGNIEPVSNACNGATFTDIFNCTIPNQLSSLEKYKSGVLQVDTPIRVLGSPSITTIGFQLPAMLFVDDPLAITQETYEYYSILDVSAEYQEVGTPSSLHSNRGYEVGIIYMDEYGRSTTALVSPNNNVHVPCSASEFKNTIDVTIPTTQIAPYWATRYKFCIKPDKKDYDIIYTNFFFRDPTSGADYFLLEGQNSQKIEVGDELIVKKDTQGTKDECTWVTVLEKEAKERNFLDPKPIDSEGNEIDYVPAGVYMKIRANNFSTALAPNSFITYNTESTSGAGRRYIYYPIDIEDPSNPGTYIPYDIPAGSKIRIKIRNLRKQTVTADKNFWKVDAIFTASQDYNDFQDWFEGDNIAVALSAQSENDGTASTGPNYDPSGTYPIAATPNAQVDSVIWNDGTRNNFVVRSSYGVNDGRKKVTLDVLIEVLRSDNLIVFESDPQDADPDLWYESSESFGITTDGEHLGNTQDQDLGTNTPGIVKTDFFNCFAFGNGVESYKIEDSIAGKELVLGNRATTTDSEVYGEERRFSDLTYSGVYNPESNINRLNEFNLGLLNFKPLEMSYGPIMKLFPRETDILTLQEDKISYVQVNKNVLSDAAGGGAITSVPEVVGQQIARVEEYGISHNPESFAQFGADKYFTDAKRGAVIQLRGGLTGADQLTVISMQGMRSWFRDLFNVSFQTQKLGGFDPYMNEYVLSSNTIALPVDTDCIECGSTRTISVSTTLPYSACYDFGEYVGDVEIDYEVVGGSGAFSVNANYNGSDYTTGDVSTSGTLTFNKSSVSNETGVVSLSAKGSFTINLTVKCPQKTIMNIVLVTLTSDAESGDTIHNEYRWNDGTFTSPLHSNYVLFDSGTHPVVSDYSIITGAQGGGYIPSDAANVTMICNEYSLDTFRFDILTDNFRYHRSNVLYNNTPAEINTLLGLSTEATPISGPTIIGTTQYSASFAMPPSGDYLYLIYDYTKSTETELCYGTDEFDACCVCSDGSLQASFIFDGINQFVEVADADDLTFGDGVTDQAFSLSAWVYLDSFGSTFNGMIINKTNEYRIRLTSGGILLFELLSNSSNRIGRRYNTLAGGDLSTWLNIVCTYDGSKTSAGMKIYINDVQVDNANQNAGTYTGMINTSATLKFMGADYIDGNANHFSVIGKELSAAEVTELYNGGLPIDITTASFASDIVSHWAMDKRDDPTTIVNDIIGTNDGTPFNMSAANLDEVNYPT